MVCLWARLSWGGARTSGAGGLPTRGGIRRSSIQDMRRHGPADGALLGCKGRCRFHRAQRPAYCAGPRVGMFPRWDCYHHPASRFNPFRGCMSRWMRFVHTGMSRTGYIPRMHCWCPPVSVIPYHWASGSFHRRYASTRTQNPRLRRMPERMPP